MKKEKNLQTNFISKDKSYVEKPPDFTIHDIIYDDFNKKENSTVKSDKKNFEVENNSISKNNKFNNLESEISISSEQYNRTFNSIELILETDKSKKSKKNNINSKVHNKQNIQIKRSAYRDKYYIRNIFFFTIILNLLAGLYVWYNFGNIKQRKLAMGIFISIVFIEWVGIALGIYFSLYSKYSKKF